MCLISLAPKGTDKYSELLLNALRIAANTNTDGMGYSFKKASTKKVFISKGFDDVEKLIEALKKHNLKLDDELMVHQRIGNKGAKNVDMMHPFVLSNDKKTILTNNKYVNLPTMVHNGTFHSYSKAGSEYSDTFWFIEGLMYRPELIELLKNDKDFFKELISAKLGINRLGFLFPNCDTNMIHLGEYKTTDEGYLFSNDSYKDKNLRNVGGVESKAFGSGSEDYDDTTYDYRTYDEYWNNKMGWPDNKPEKATGVDKSVNDFVKNVEVNRNRSHITTPNMKKASIIDGDIVLTGGTAIDCKETGVKYRFFMDMWIPEKYSTHNQFNSVRFNPTEYNFTDFVFKAVESDTDIGIIKGRFYEIINYDKENGEKLHILRRAYTGDTISQKEWIYVPEYLLPQYFTINPKGLFIKKYEGYFRLVQKLAPSKNLFKRITKMLNPSKFKEKSVYTYKGACYDTAASMCIYQLLLAKHLYPKTYRQEINKLSMVMIPA